MNWSDITLKQFHQLDEISKSEIEGIEKTYARLKVLGIEPDTSNLVKLNEQIPTFLNNLPDTELRKTYIISGKQFVPHINFTTIHTGRFLDIHNQIKGKNPSDLREWPYLLALCMSEFGEPYHYQKHIDRAEWLYENMTFDQAYPIMVFFSKVWTILQTIILDSSMEKLRIQLKELMRSYKESTDSSQSIGAGLATFQK